jgi:hypothetical protein
MTERQLVEKGLELSKRGVNTVIANHSYQFLPNIPDGTSQWKKQVNWSFAERFTNAMHKAGLRVIHHTTSTFVPIEAKDYPEYQGMWSLGLTTQELTLMPSGASYSDAVFADMNDPGFRAIVFSRMREFMHLIKPDAFMVDEVEWLPDIYASGSIRGSWVKFKSIYALDYPQGTTINDWNSLHWRKYVQFRFESGGQFYKDLTEVLRQENSETVVTGCLASISTGGWAPHWAQGSESWMDGWSLGFHELQTASGQNVKTGTGFLYATLWPSYYRSCALWNAYGERNDYWVTYNLSYPQTWQQVDSEQFYSWAQSLLMGNRYWMRDYQSELHWYMWEEDYEDELSDPRWIGDIGVLYPEQGTWEPTVGSERLKDWQGVCEALAYNNVMYDMLVRWHFGGNRLSRFKVIFIPSARYLSDAMLDEIEAFVNNGGTAVFTADCMIGTFDGSENGTNLSKLQSLLGISSSSSMQWQSGTYYVTAKPQKDLIPYGTVSYLDGYVQVIPATGATKLFNIDGTYDAGVIKKTIGQGQTYFFTGRLSARAAENTKQWEYSVYTPVANIGYRYYVANLAKNLLNNRRRVEVDGLPSEVMVNAYDCVGNADGKTRRTIHILDSIGGFDPGEAWRTAGQPLLFTTISSRINGNPVHVYLRDITGVSNVKLISPDSSQVQTLQAVYDSAKQAWKIEINSTLLKRYSVVVAELL